ncbi:MAG: uroporphyrinogen-III C-methyltransferase [Coriobacteriia bacterium]|nr:uroporphyrinogen-III C-methyltransferase [Coriobacteriia bacterium]
MATKPLVYLIGAGPGDPGLMTIKGLECLKKADIVVYDYLANPCFLAYANLDAELIYVGKKGFSKHVTQDEINELLIETAQRDGGKIVARLKGGDPFIFGRGGEEALALSEHNISFEVVPGISSGYAAPTYAGIPVTHRGITTDMAFVTGHEDPTKQTSDINWKGLATAVGTICFFMGIKNLPTITARLVENGRDENTPVALIRWGTTPRQEVLVGTLADIAEKAAQANFQAPAITLVGEAVALREKLQWFENKPLFGKSIVVTRSRAQASDLVDKLAELGAETLEFPTIRIKEPSSWTEADAAIAAIESYDWIVFTSTNGVDGFFDRLKTKEKDVRCLAQARFAAVGSTTATSLAQRGIRADYVPAEYNAEGLLEGFLEQGLNAKSKVLVSRAKEAREVLPSVLREHGVQVDVAAVYETVMGHGSASVVERFVEGDIDVVTFTSSSTVKNFMELLRAGLPKGTSASEVLKGVKIVSIGPITSQTAQELGLVVDCEAKQATIDGLVLAVAELFGKEI